MSAPGHRRKTLAEEARMAARGVRRLLTGRADAVNCFDWSERGLAGSFIPLILALAIVAVFIGFANTAGSVGPGATTQLFVAGATTGLRYGAVRLALPYLDPGPEIRARAFMVATNWTAAIWIGLVMSVTVAGSFAGALLLGPGGAETLVTLILTLWAGAAIGALVIEINIYRLIVGLDWVGIAFVISAQVSALLAGVFILAHLL